MLEISWGYAPIINFLGALKMGYTPQISNFYRTLMIKHEILGYPIETNP
jgi:hypothetical protein